jgi:hypothetical protein
MWRLIGVGIAVITAAAAAAYHWWRPGADGADGQKDGRQPPNPSPNQPYEPWQDSLDEAPRTFPPSSGQETRRKPGRAPEPIGDTPKTNRDAPSTNVMTTKMHIWLLDVPNGETLSAETIEQKFHAKPSIGWQTTGSLVLAAFTRAEMLQPYGENQRLKITPLDYNSVALASISTQAVPVFTQNEIGWTFKGFFRFRRPAAQSVGCDKINGKPPELERLKEALDASGGHDQSRLLGT